jgi:serine protease Do
VLGGNRDVIVSGRSLRAGGDILIAINGTEVNDFDDLVNYLASSTSVGDPVVLNLVRDGEELTLELTLEERPGNR